MRTTNGLNDSKTSSSRSNPLLIRHQCPAATQPICHICKTATLPIAQPTQPKSPTVQPRCSVLAPKTIWYQRPPPPSPSATEPLAYTSDGMDEHGIKEPVCLPLTSRLSRTPLPTLHWRQHTTMQWFAPVPCGPWLCLPRPTSCARPRWLVIYL